MVMRINKIITYMKMICFSNKFLQLIFIKEMYGEHLKEFWKGLISFSCLIIQGERKSVLQPAIRASCS